MYFLSKYIFLLFLLINKIYIYVVKLFFNTKSKQIIKWVNFLLLFVLGSVELYCFMMLFFKFKLNERLGFVGVEGVDILSGNIPKLFGLFDHI